MKRQVTVRVGLAVVGLVASVAYAGNPVLLSAPDITSGGSPIVAESNNKGAIGNPLVVDWNNDGKKDLVVGNGSGKIRLYLNEGSDASPSFNGYTYLQCAGVDIQLPHT